jgi:hypothetical protein
MKSILVAMLGLQAISYGAISISGISGSGFGAVDVPVGALVLFLVDDSNNGFLGNNALTDPMLQGANASTTLGERFGGDMVFGRASVTTAGQIPFTLTGFDQTFGTAPFATAGAGRNFAIIWLQDNTSSTTGAASGDYGIIRGLDWVIPSGDGNFTASATATSYAGATVFARVTNTSGVLANQALGTPSASFAIVPEPSSALLGVLGALGFLRRRRN